MEVSFFCYIFAVQKKNKRTKQNNNYYFMENTNLKKGDVIGQVVVYYDNKKCGEVDLLAYSDVERSFLAHMDNRISNFTDSVLFKIIIILLILTVIVVVANKNKNEKNF